MSLCGVINVLSTWTPCQLNTQSREGQWLSVGAGGRESWSNAEEKENKNEERPLRPRFSGTTNVISVF